MTNRDDASIPKISQICCFSACVIEPLFVSMSMDSSRHKLSKSCNLTYFFVRHLVTNRAKNRKYAKTCIYKSILGESKTQVFEKKRRAPCYSARKNAWETPKKHYKSRKKCFFNHSTLPSTNLMGITMQNFKVMARVPNIVRPCWAFIFGVFISIQITSKWVVRNWKV